MKNEIENFEAKQETQKNLPVAEVFDSSQDKWDDIRDEIWELLKLNVAPEGIELENNPHFNNEMLKSFFEDPENVVVLLKNLKTKAILGFTFTIPDECEDVKTAYIYSVKIHPKFQGKKMIVKLMEILETELKKRGYKQFTEDARVLNGYADKIQKTYKNRIIESYDHDSIYGPQRYFKITL